MAGTYTATIGNTSVPITQIVPDSDLAPMHHMLIQVTSGSVYVMPYGGSNGHPLINGQAMEIHGPKKGITLIRDGGSDATVVVTSGVGHIFIYV